MRNLVLILAVLFASIFSEAQQYLQKQDSQVINKLINAGFENGKASWAISVSSTAQIVSGSSAIQDAASLRFDATAASQTVKTALYVMPVVKDVQDSGTVAKCESALRYLTSETASPYVYSVINQSGTTISTIPLPAVSTATTVYMPFDCPNSALLEIKSTANALPIDLDSAHLGSRIHLVKSDVTSAIGYEPVATVSASLPLIITGGASNPVISLNNSGATSGAIYTKVQVDGKGRVTSGTTLTASDFPNSGVTSGTYTKVQVTSAGIVVSGSSLAASDIPNLDISKITGVVPISQGGTSATTATSAFDNLAPSTTKGDIIVYNGTDNIRVPVGANDYVLSADSTQASGVSWKSVSGTTGLSPVIYYNSAAQSIPNASATVVNFNTVIRDPDSAVTTGTNWRYVAIVSQTVLVATQISFASNNYGANVIFEANLYKNGANPISMGQVTHPVNTATQAPNINGTAVVQLSPGDYFDIRAYQNTGGPQPLVAGVQYSRINIIKLGTSF